MPGTRTEESAEHAGGGGGGGTAGRPRPGCGRPQSGRCAGAPAQRRQSRRARRDRATGRPRRPRSGAGQEPRRPGGRPAGQDLRRRHRHRRAQAGGQGAGHQVLGREHHRWRSRARPGQEDRRLADGQQRAGRRDRYRRRHQGRRRREIRVGPAGQQLDPRDGELPGEDGAAGRRRHRRPRRQPEGHSLAGCQHRQDRAGTGQAPGPGRHGVQADRSRAGGHRPDAHCLLPRRHRRRG